MCNCNKRTTTAATKHTVTYPDGTTETKDSKVAARLAAARVPGATVTPAAP